ncbi:Nn.00g039030.m01.CDS01 [Neocucurbitaria sp. VM-36]
MANRRRLLGVFVPSTPKQPAPTPTPTPAPNTSNSSAPPPLVVPPPPLTAERRAQLDANDLPDYDAMTDDELIALMRERNVGLRGRPKRVHKVNALRGLDERDRGVWGEWREGVERVEREKREGEGDKEGEKVEEMEKEKGEKVEEMEKKKEGDMVDGEEEGEEESTIGSYEPGECHHMAELRREKLVRRRLKELAERQHQSLMFASAYRADPACKSFLDLPAEVRNMIYDLALFDPELDLTTIKASYDDDTVRLRPEFNPGREYDGAVMISVLNMLGAMNRQIRREVRGWFYKQITLRIQGSLKEDENTHNLLQRVLEKIGKEGRAYLPYLYSPIIFFWRMDFQQVGYDSFHSLLGTMALCQSLQRVDLCLSISHLLYTDIEQLQDYFFFQATLESPGLERLVAVLSSMSNLQNVYLITRPFSSRGSAKESTEENLFRRFAFTGMREVMLWLEVSERLQANNVNYASWSSEPSDTRKFNDKTFVWIKHPNLIVTSEDDEITDFPTWLDWREWAFPGKIKGKAVVEEVANDGE